MTAKDRAATLPFIAFAMVISNPKPLTPRQHQRPNNNESRFEIGECFGVLMYKIAGREGGFVSLTLELAASPPLT